MPAIWSTFANFITAVGTDRSAVLTLLYTTLCCFYRYIAKLARYTNIITTGIKRIPITNHRKTKCIPPLTELSRRRMADQTFAVTTEDARQPRLQYNTPRFGAPREPRARARGLLNLPFSRARNIEACTLGADTYLPRTHPSATISRPHYAIPFQSSRGIAEQKKVRPPRGNIEWILIPRCVSR